MKKPKPEGAFDMIQYQIFEFQWKNYLKIARERKATKRGFWIRQSARCNLDTSILNCGKSTTLDDIIRNASTYHSAD